jgi:hypothetical protein
LKVRKLQKLAATAGLVAISVLGLQAMAGAQSSGYPGTIVPGTSSVTITLALTTSANGTASPVTVCGFEPGSTTNYGVANAAGFVTLTITGFDPSFSVNGGPKITAVFGLNSNAVAVTGVNTTGGTQTDLVNVILTAPSNSGLAFTGADILAMVVGGLGLIAVGFLILTFVRRRHVAPAV